MAGRLILYLVGAWLALKLLIAGRQGARATRGYRLLLLGDLAVIGAVLQADAAASVWGFLAVGVFVGLVTIPWLLRLLADRAQARDDLDRAVRWTLLRELFQPGAGVGHERELLSGLAQVRAGRGAQAVETLRRRREAAAAAPEEGRRIDAQIVTVLLFDRRFAEAVEHFERALDLGYAAAHAALGANLVRAYAGLDDLERAAALLAALEEGPAARDPGAGAALNHARLALLATAGEATAVEALLGDGSAFMGGLPPRLRHLWLGVAHARAGDAPRARPHLERVRGATGDGISRAAARELERLEDPAAASAPPALSPRAAEVVRLAERRAAETAAIPRARIRARLVPATWALLVANALCWGAMELVGGSTDPLTLVAFGANFKAAARAGELQRLASAMFLHVGELHLGLNLYALLVLGRFLEQLLGSSRFLLLYVAGGLLGSAASLLLGPGPLSAGASGAVFALIGGGIVTLLLGRDHYPDGWRRSVATNLAALAAVNLFIGWRIEMVDNAAHLGGLVGGASLALLLAPRGAARPGPRAGRAARAGAAVALAVLGAAAVATAATSIEQTFARLPRREVVVAGLRGPVPAHWSDRLPDGTPVDGLRDPLLELVRTFSVVRLPREGTREQAAAARVARVRAELAQTEDVVAATPLPASPPLPAAAPAWAEARLRFVVREEGPLRGARHAAYVELVYVGDLGEDRFAVALTAPERHLAAYRLLVARFLAEARPAAP